MDEVSKTQKTVSIARDKTIKEHTLLMWAIPQDSKTMTLCVVSLKLGSNSCQMHFALISFFKTVCVSKHVKMSSSLAKFELPLELAHDSCQRMGLVSGKLLGPRHCLSFLIATHLGIGELPELEVLDSGLRILLDTNSPLSRAVFIKTSLP